MDDAGIEEWTWPGNCIPVPTVDIGAVVVVVVAGGILDTGATVAPAAAAVGGISYFCIWRRYASACGIEPQQTSKELVEARTS